MKKTNILKIAFDIVMAVLFVLLFNKMAIAGLVFHEIAGLVIGAAFVIHLILNWKWIAQVTKNLFSSKTSLKTKIGYIVNVLLFIFMAVILITGIFISKVVFTGIISGGLPSFKTLHVSVSHVALCLLGIHVGLHWGWVMDMLQRITRFSPKGKALTYAARFVVIAVFALGIYNMTAVNYISGVSIIPALITGGQTQGPSGGGKFIEGEAQREQNETACNSSSISPQSNSDRGGSAAAPPKGGGKDRAFAGREGGNTSVPQILYTYISILSVPAIITYYLEKLLTRKRKIKEIPACI